MRRSGRKYEPALTIVTAVGDVSVVARVCEITPNAVYRWMRPRDEGGLAGEVPGRHLRKIYRYCRQHDIAIDADVFLQDPRQV